MLEVTTGLAVFTALCLATKALRFYAFVGIPILSMLFPLAALVLALAGASGYLLFRNRFK